MRMVLKDTLYGALAGFAATVPMTATMALLHRMLPWWQQGPLPPHEVTRQVLDRIGLDEVDDRYHTAATAASHFTYGAGIGALLGPLARVLPFSKPLFGIVYGLAVWAGSYLGWLPAVSVLEPATERPMPRNLLMIAAHLVWGAAAGGLLAALQGDTQEHDGRSQKEV